MHIHILGVCGTFMGGIAALARASGHLVSGSDRNVYPPMSTQLAALGIPVHEGYAPSQLDPPPDCVIVGNVMSRGNAAVEHMLDAGLAYTSGPQWLAEHVLARRFVLAVAGTHGKTTTASMLAWILEHAGLEPGFLIGGVPQNFGLSARLGRGAHFVVEADEYDTAFFDKRSKFLHYLPELVIVNNLEFDHADIFPDLEAIKLSFRRLLNIVPSEGMVLINGDDANAVEVAQGCRAQLVEVGFSPNAARHIRDVRFHERGSQFTLLETRFATRLVGEFNVRNAAMAVSAAHFYGVPLETIRAALEKFEGVRRRQEVRGTVRGITVIDDFGHHPTAIRETLRGLRHVYPGRRLWALFEPRSNTTRRAVFQDALPAALAEADGVILAQVARMEQLPPEERLRPEQVVADIAAAGRMAFYEPDVDAIVARLRPLVREKDVIVVLSNGGFGGIHQRLLAEL
jgi:UDP-N-acetylmuramate: L-alanyl-gamma-D-glutamyl-meso-diaminopimelate ligase